MASSNIKSLVIKQNKAISETISDIDFRLLYNAIKEVVDYWDDVTIDLDVKDAYLEKYNLTTFIEVEGRIAVRNVYIEELQYICLHVNGSAGNTIKNLIIDPGFNYYVQLSDKYMQPIFAQTIYFDKSNLDGVTLLDLNQSQWTWITWDEGNEYNPLAGNYKETWIEHVGPGDLADKQNCVASIPDKYIFTNTDDIDKIKVFDFTPYYHIFALYSKARVTNLYGHTWSHDGNLAPITPKLLTNIPSLAASSRKKNIDEMWYYVPQDYNVTWGAASWLLLSPATNPALGGKYSDSERQTAAFAAWGDNNTGKVMTVDRLFVKMWGFGDNRFSNNLYKDRIINVNHICLDLGRPSQHLWGPFGSREWGDPWERYPLNPAQKTVILIIPFLRPPSFESDEDAMAFYTDPTKVRYLERILWNSNIDAISSEEIDGNQIMNMHCYVPNYSTFDGSGYTGWQFFVDDEWYYALKYMLRVKERDGATAHQVNFVNTACLHKWSEYKDIYGSPYYNASTRKFWWQTNTTLNSIISTYNKQDDMHGNYLTA